MNRLNLLDSIIIVTVVCFFLVLLFGAGFFWPKYQALSGLQKGIEERTVQLQHKEKYFSGLKDIQAELKKYETELSKIDSALPSNPSLPSLFSFIQKTSSQSGLVLKGISPFAISAAEGAPKIKTIQFSLQVSGSYQSFKNFLSILEKSARIIEVENISFSSPEEGDLFTFNLNIKVHSY